MRNLAKAFPQYGTDLLKVRERIVDLLQLTRSSYYHPEFHGSYSIKSVVSALAPGLVYDDLEIREGTSAAAHYARLVGGDVPESERHQIREALIAYCATDTEAMVCVYEALTAETDS